MESSSYQIGDAFRGISDLFNLVVFTGLAIYGLASWLRRRDPATGWFAGMFASLSIVILTNTIVGEENVNGLLARAEVALLGLTPLCLYRFTRSFARGNRWIDVVSTALTVIVVIWSFLITIPDSNDNWGTGVVLFVATFLGHWVLLSVASAVFFLREARRAQGVASRRMRLFAIATLTLAAALLLSGFGDDTERSTLQDVLGAIIQTAAVVSGLLFWFAMVPPRALRASWRSREFDSMQGGLRELVAGETLDEVRHRTLDAAMQLAGGSAGVVLDEDGEIVHRRNIEPHDAERMVAESRSAAEVGRDARRIMAVDRLVVACSPAAPFFGAEERQLLDTLSAFALLAEERAQVLMRERDANERLRQLDQLKTEFVAMVAHDLRSPMSVITGFADTIHDRWHDITDEDKLEYLRLISRNTRSLADFVEDVLQVARMESGELRYRLEPFDAREVVQRIVRDMQVAHPDLTLTVDAPEELPQVLGDAERNWQILMNLVSNAMKFSEGEPHVRVRITALPDEHAVSIAVRDHGIGISSEDLPCLFRRFSRVGPSRRTVAGTGLGLYIVKAMVEAQGGRIWVQSEPGAGSTFTYTVPMANEEAVA